MRILIDDTARARFLCKFEQDLNGCWLWIGSLNNKGYGQLRYRGRPYLAHRFALLLDGQELFADREVDHLCRVTRCVNPAHLEQVTHRTNMLRSTAPAKTIERAKAQVECRSGHPLSGSNLYVHNGKRTCKRCKIDRQRNYRSARSMA